MFSKLIHLERKAFFRSASLGKSIAIKVFIGFMVLYFGLIFLVLGFALPDVLRKAFPDSDPIQVINRFLVLWFLGDLFMRFMLQNLPVLEIKPLLVQRIKKSTLVHFLLSKSIFHWINLFTPIVFIPFILVTISEGTYTKTQLLSWLIMVFLWVLVLNFLNFIIQKKFAENIKGLIPFFVILAALVGLEYYGIFSSTAWLGQGFALVLVHPVLLLLPALILIFLYRANFNYLKSHLYLDTVVRDKSLAYRESDLSWTHRFGAVAPFLQLDLRLIWRNKRARSVLSLSVLFAFYGLLFYPNPSFADSSMLVFVGIFITGIFVMNFGQFIPAWDGGYYSLLMSQNIPLRLYLESKVILLYISVAILSIVSIAYAYFGWNILAINLACAIYNLGINVPLVLYFGSYSKKKIELDRGQFFNYQGTGAAQWIVSIPVILAPILIWMVANALSDQWTASVILGLIGLIGLLFKKWIMNKIEESYRSRKHVMLESFKQQG